MPLTHQCRTCGRQSTVLINGQCKLCLRGAGERDQVRELVRWRMERVLREVRK